MNPIILDLGFSKPELLSLRKGAYRDGNAALIVRLDYHDDEGDIEEYPVSVNLPGNSSRLKPGEYFLKDYSEGENMAKALVAAGLIEYLNVPRVPSGYVEIPIVKLTPLGEQFSSR